MLIPKKSVIGAREYASSSFITTWSMIPMSMPPYCFGQCGTSQPFAASFFWNCFPKAQSASLSTSSPCSLSGVSSCLRNVRISVRNFSCSSVNR